MNRRKFIGHSAVSIGALAVGGPVLLQTGCSPKNLSVYVQTVVGALKEITALLPNSAQLIAKAVSIAEAFDKAYREKKFENATGLFENLVGVISQIMAATGIENPTVKVALAVAGIAIRAIAVLLASQAQDPAVAVALSRPSARSRVSLIQKLADAAAVDKAFEVARL